MAITQVTEPTEEGFDARRFFDHALEMARRRRSIMLAVFAAALVGGVAVVLLRPDVYRAETFLAVAQPAQRADTGGGEVPVVSDVISATATRSVATHIAIMKTPAVQNGAYEYLPRRFHDLLKPGRSIWQGRPSISMQPLDVGTLRADVIKISVSWRDPEAAAALANAIAQRHIRFTREFNRDITLSALPYLETELTEARRKVEEAERALLTEQRNSQLFNAEEQIRTKTAAAGEAEKAADQAALEQKAAQAQLANLKAAIAREPAMRTSSETDATNPVTDKLRASVAEMKVRRSALLTDYSVDSPEVRQVDRQISAAEDILAKEKPTVTTSEEKSLNAVREELRQELARIEASAAAAAARERENRALYQRYVKELHDLNAAQARLLEYNTSAELVREYYRVLREKSQSLTMRAQARLPDISILSEAEVPNEPEGPHKAVQVLFVLFVSAFLSYGAALVAEMLSPKLCPVEATPMVSAE